MVSWSPFCNGKNFMIVPPRCFLWLALGTSRLIAAIKEVREDLEVNLCVWWWRSTLLLFFCNAYVENPKCSDFCGLKSCFLFKFWHLHFTFRRKRPGKMARPNFLRTSSGQLKVLQNAGKLWKNHLLTDRFLSFYKRKTSFPLILHQSVAVHH